ncbi:MAG: transcriptional regulator [Phycisphaerales bacterium]|nr:transcriptional regulator [Phycisphaerales bacterium]
MNVDRVRRLLQLLTLLRSGKAFGADRLAAELQISRRTVFRDLKLLESAGVPYKFEHDEGNYKLEMSLSLPPTQLNMDEALALLLATRVMMSSAAHPMYRAVSDAALKIESGLPGSVLRHCGAWLEGLDVLPEPMSPIESVADLFADLQAALARRERIHLVYDSVYDGGEIRLFVDPARLIFATRGWYLIAWSHSHDAYRTFKVDRILSAEFTGDTFEPRTDFSCDTYFGKAWRMIPDGVVYNVRLRFDAEVATSVEEVQWHATQSTCRDRAGRLIFEAEVDGLKEIAPWILGYGEHVEVLAPKELRDVIREKAERILANAQVVEREANV